MLAFPRRERLAMFTGVVLLASCCMLFIAAIPQIVHAQLVISDLVTCGDDISYVGDDVSGFTYTGECDVCDFQRLLQRVLSFLIGIMTAVAALLFANAGVLYVTSPANAAAVSKAHRLFMNTLVGVLIILAAYLLIDFGMKSLLPGTDGDINSAGPWNTILCAGGDPNSYYVPPLEKTVLGVDPYELPPIATNPELTCAQKGGTCKSRATRGNPNPSCPDGKREISAETSDCSSGGCCVPTSLDNTCTHSTGKQGTCYPHDLCTQRGGTGEISADCGGTTQGQYCCVVEVLEPTPDGEYDCNDMASLQEEFGGAGPVNGPGLDAMIACYENDPEVKKWRDSQPPYTHELTLPASWQDPICDYTNGRAVCGVSKCSHSVGSCHYGAGTGLGALAADFNGTNEGKLYEAIKAAQSKCGGKVHYEPSHTHVSLDICPKL